MTDEEVFGKPQEMSDAEVFGAPPPTAGEAIPEAFIGRLRAGEAIGRILQAAGKEAANVPEGTPTGFENDTLNLLIEKGIFHDPLKSRPGPIQMANEAVMLPAAQAWQAIVRGTAMGIHGAGGLVGQIMDEFGVSNEPGLFFRGGGESAKREIINAGNWAMIEAGMGRFARPHVEGGAVADRVVGGLPTEADFVNAGKVMPSPHTEANLRRMWKEDGITPAEAVHDAAGDAFLKNEITAYHGSRHNFDVFSVEKIGSGEGAQSYGYGLYFAENPSVARSYQLMDEATINGRPYDMNNPFHKAVSLVDEFGSREGAIKEAKARTAHDPGDYYGEVLTHLENGKTLPQLDTTGNLYQVKILADKEQFLDLDKRLNEQAPEVQQAVKRAMGIDYHGNFDAAKSDWLWNEFQHADGKVAVRQGFIASDDKLVAKRLSDAGIPGLKYLDEGSRGAGDGTRNFVVFDDKHVQITHKNEVMVGGYSMPKEDFDVLTETGGRPGSLSAAATEPPDIPLEIQPAQPPGTLMGAARAAADTLFDMGRDAQMLVAPMARGTTDSMAMAKDFANTMRRNRWDWSRIDKDIEKRFDPETRKRMWNAMDEESLSLRLEEPASAREHQGLNTLTPEERAAVVDLDNRQQLAWARAIDLGMVEGEGIPMHAPRMVINIANASDKEGAMALDVIGRNLRTRTPYLKQRKYMEVEETEAAAKAKYGPQAEVLRDIRTVALSTAQLEDAIAGRQLINNIKEYGARTGTDTVAEGAIPAGSETKWFTLDHPSFKTWRPKFDESKVVKDAEGNVVFEQVPIYVHGDFEGPLRAVLDHRSGAIYGGMMALKGKTMSLIMNSPMIHNAVEWGRAVFAMPGKVATFKVYFEGNRAKNNVPLMHEAIDNGLVPIGHRFFNQDISGLMEQPDLTPGRSTTAKMLAVVPGLFDEAAGVAVKRAIDKAGDFWHNTLLWDRVADLQMGLYVNFRSDMMAKGIDQTTASRIAAHWANRYAGALPKEAMSDGATKIANFMLFSRSFTLGNMGVLKDMMTGLPKDVLAQIERDAGFRAGSIEAGIEAGEQAKSAAKSMARRKAMAVVGMDIVGMYVMNSLLQNAVNVIFNDSTVDKELHGYTARLKQALTEIGEHPLKLVQPFGFAEHIAATSENEPGRQERVRVGYAKDGTAIYGRAPVGKIGEEFIGYMTGPLDMMRKKQGTIARPLSQIFSNDAGFGRKIYDPTADLPEKYLQNVYLIAKHLALSQFPEGQISAFRDLVKGEGDAKVNALQAFGPFAGVTFSKGAPGGPAVGEMYASKAQYEFRVNQALPDIRKQILRGDIDGAIGRMTELDVPQGLQRFYIRTTINPAARLSPRATRDFYLHSTPEQIKRFERALGAQPKP